MGIKDDIRNRLTDFKDLCIEHRVKTMYAFGSSITNSYDPLTSDIDLLVEVDYADPIERGEKLLSLWDKLETFFKRKIDLLTDSSIRNPVLRKNIDNHKILIYDRQGQEISI